MEEYKDWDPHSDEDYNPRGWKPWHDKEDNYHDGVLDSQRNPSQDSKEYLITSSTQFNRFARYFRSSMNRLSDMALEIEHSDLPSIFKARAENQRQFISDYLAIFSKYHSQLWNLTEERPAIVDRSVETLQDLEDEIYTLREEIVCYEAKTGKSILT